MRNPTLTKSIPRRERRRTSKEERQQWVEAWERSDQTQQRFAAAHGLSVGTLRNWIRGSAARAARSKVGPSFRELSIGEILGGSPSEQSAGWEAEIRLPNGVVIAMSRSAAIDRVKQLLEAVRC